jgi:hypothetical protein
MNSGDSCKVVVDADILGLGTRIGIYFQLAASIAIYVVHPNEAKIAVVVSAMLLTSFFISMAFSIAQDTFPPGAILSAVYILVLEIFTMLPIILCLTLSVWTYVLYALRYNAMLGLFIWFWFRGLHSGSEAQCMEPRIVLLYYDFGAYGWISKLLGAWTIVYAVISVIITADAIFLVKKCINRGTTDYEDRWGINWEDILRSHQEMERNCFTFLRRTLYFIPEGFSVSADRIDEMIRSMKQDFNDDLGLGWYFVTLLRGLIFVACVIYTEVSIFCNKLSGIGGVSTSGQIMSLAIGSLSLVRVLWRIFMSRQWIVTQFRAFELAEEARIQAREADTEERRQGTEADMEGIDRGSEIRINNPSNSRLLRTGSAPNVGSSRVELRTYARSLS